MIKFANAFIDKQNFKMYWTTCNILILPTYAYSMYLLLRKMYQIDTHTHTHTHTQGADEDKTKSENEKEREYKNNLQSESSEYQGISRARQAERIRKYPRRLA